MWISCAQDRRISVFTAGEMVSLPLRRSLGMPATVDWRTRVYCPPSVSRCVRSPSESAELTF
jgi:hypothetical protein